MPLRGGRIGLADVGHVRQFDAVASRLLTRLAKQAPLLSAARPGNQHVLVDAFTRPEPLLLPSVDRGSERGPGVVGALDPLWPRRLA
jgi:hypothetical protein